MYFPKSSKEQTGYKKKRGGGGGGVADGAAGGMVSKPLSDGSF